MSDKHLAEFNNKLLNTRNFLCYNVHMSKWKKEDDRNTRSLQDMLCKLNLKY